MSETQARRTADEVQSYLNDDFKQWLEALLEKYHVPGMSVAVINGSKIESAGYGLARLPDVHATADTLYCMGSTTKPFTSALIGMLIHENASKEKKAVKPKLSWSTPISELLPDDFVTTDPYITKKTTIEDALSHRSGIAGHDLFWGPEMGTTASATRSLRHLGPITAPFRGKFQYNNLMFGVIGQVIEQLSGQKYSEILRQRILEPLGMHNTYSGVNAASEAWTKNTKLPFARGYYWVESDDAAQMPDSKTENEGKERRGYYVPEAYIGLGGIGPAGDNISSVKDYAKWAQALLAGSKPPADEKKPDTISDTLHAPSPSELVVNNSLFRDLTTPRMINLPLMNFFPDVNILPTNAYMTPHLYALGWMIHPFVAPGEQVIGHGGGLPGFGSEVYLVPNHDFAVIAVGNTGLMASQASEAVAKELIGRRLGKGVKERRKHGEPEKKEEKTVDIKAEEAEVKDVPERETASSEVDDVQTSKGSFDDRKSDIVGQYTQGAYGTVALSRATDPVGFDAQKPEMDGTRIERKKKPDAKSVKAASAPLIIHPIPRRGLNWRLIMHNPRTSANDKTKVIYGLEMLLCHGDLTDDPFGKLPQEFPDEISEKYPLKRDAVWQSQTYDKKAAVVELDEAGQVKKLGLQLFRVDIPEKSGKEEAADDELEHGWEDQLVWFQKAEKE